MGIKLKPSFIKTVNPCSTKILLACVFVLVFFTIIESPLRTSIAHHFLSGTPEGSTSSAASTESNKSLESMDEITPETDLEYHFKAEDLIKEGRVSKDDVEEIRTFISNLDDKYVPIRIQDEIIIIFLLSCAHDVELTKKTIVSYYYLKRHGPEIYDDRDLNRSDIQLAMKTVHMSSIPVRTEENDVFHYFNLHDTNYRNFELIPIMKISYMLMDIAQDKNPPSGLIVVIDMKGAGLMHMTRIKMDAIKKYFQFLQEGFPMKLKLIHFINSVYFIDKILAIIKVFIKSELMDMIHIHSPNLEGEKLFKIIPKKYLPKEYGGDLPSESELHEQTIELFKSKQTFWNMEEKLRKLAYKG